MVYLLLALILLPTLELALLIELGRQVGTWPTIGLVLGTGVGGDGLGEVPGHGGLAPDGRRAQRGSDPRGGSLRWPFDLHRWTAPGHSGLDNRYSGPLAPFALDPETNQGKGSGQDL